jgi:hypothetical protein
MLRSRPARRGWESTVSLYPGVRIKEDEVRTTYRLDKWVEPLPAQWCSARHLLAQEDRILQYSTHVQFRQRINELAAASVKFHELIKYLRSEVSKVIGALKIVEMSVAIVRCIGFAGQVPANSKAAIFHKMPKQSDLSEVAYSSDLPNLHCASQHITGDASSSGSVGLKFRQLSRKSHTSNMVVISDQWSRSWRTIPGKSLS